MGLDVEKIIQAAGVLFRGEGTEQMSRLRLLKLLYIADRESLAETGETITGDDVLAMKYGPVLSGTYSLIKDEHVRSSLWNQFFGWQGYRVVLSRPPENGRLCQYEVEKLLDVAQRYGALPDEDLAEETHRFPEYIKHKPQGNSSERIPLADIIDAVGRTPDKESILRNAEDREEFSRLLGVKAC